MDVLPIYKKKRIITKFGTERERLGKITGTFGKFSIETVRDTDLTEACRPLSGQR